MRASLFPLVVYRANLELGRQILEAWRQSGDDWAALGQYLLNGAVTEPVREAEALAQAEDAPSVAAVVASGACQQMDRSYADAQTVFEMALANHNTLFVNVWRALQAWQLEVTGAWSPGQPGTPEALDAAPAKAPPLTARMLRAVELKAA